jgi:hypothetical protein
MSDSEKKDLDRALEGVDENRRSFLRKVVLTTAFTAPIVASFAVDGMMISSAMAAPNSTNSS